MQFTTDKDVVDWIIKSSLIPYNEEIPKAHFTSNITLQSIKDMLDDIGADNVSSNIEMYRWGRRKLVVEVLIDRGLTTQSVRTFTLKEEAPCQQQKD